MCILQQTTLLRKFIRKKIQKRSDLACKHIAISCYDMKFNNSTKLSCTFSFQVLSVSELLTGKHALLKNFQRDSTFHQLRREAREARRTKKRMSCESEEMMMQTLDDKNILKMCSFVHTN